MENIVAERIQKRMDELGKNPSSVALEAGLGRSSVRDIILGRVTHPRIDTLRKIAGPLQCTVDYLTGESAGPQANGIYRNLWYMDAQLDVPTLLEAGVFRQRAKTGDPSVPTEHYLIPDDTILNVSLRDPRLPLWSHRLFVMGDNSLQALGIIKGDGLTAVNDDYDGQIPLTHGSIVVVRQTLRDVDIEEISARQVQISKEGIYLMCRGNTAAADILLANWAVDNESNLLPNFYPAEKHTVEVLGVVVRVIRELPISDAMTDFTHIND